MSHQSSKIPEDYEAEKYALMVIRCGYCRSEIRDIDLFVSGPMVCCDEWAFVYEDYSAAKEY